MTTYHRNPIDSNARDAAALQRIHHLYPIALGIDDAQLAAPGGRVRLAGTPGGQPGCYQGRVACRHADMVGQVYTRLAVLDELGHLLLIFMRKPNLDRHFERLGVPQQSHFPVCPAQDMGHQVERFCRLGIMPQGR
jgi:hypothetical protein